MSSVASTSSKLAVMALRLTLAVVITATGCGRIGFDTTARDVPDDVSPGVGPFGPPVELVELDGAGADDPALTADELEIVFTSDRAGGVGTCDVWTASRGTTTSGWSAVTSLGGTVNTVGCDSGGVLAPDGLTLWLTIEVTNIDGDLFEARRATRTSPWQAPVVQSSLNSAMSDSATTVTADALTLALHSNRSGAHRLYLATRASTAVPWGTPTIIGPLTTGTRERSPHLSHDGLTLWFVSNQLGTQDLWVAVRADASSPFGSATPVAELSTDENEDDPWVSGDGHRIYFARYPAVGGGTLWLASR